jgi:hypothetical protein
MRTKVGAVLPEKVLTRVLEAFGQELIDASDEEVMEAAEDLGMKPHMKGSAAFLGLTFPAKWKVSDVFDIESIREQISRGITADLSTSTDPDSKAPRSKLPKNSTPDKDSGQS